MELTWVTYAVVCPLIFLAGFIDSVAGGGGLISLPAYYLAGLPPFLAAGTNKLSACLGTIASAGSYIRGKRVAWVTAACGAVMALAGSALGTRTALAIDERVIRIMMVCIIPIVAVIVLLPRKAAKKRELPMGIVVLLSCLIGFGIGFYDGMVGPGTGTFLIILFTMVLGMNAVHASGTAKLINLASNVASLVTFALEGKVIIVLGLPAAVCSIAGNLLGAHLTMKNGAAFIRRLLLVVLALLLIKMAADVISPGWMEALSLQTATITDL